MDQASASPEASCAHNPVAPRTSSSCSRSVDRSRTGGPPHARSGPQCEPHAAPSNRDSRPSSPAPCRLKAKGYLLPEFYSGATGRSGRFNEGLLLRRLHFRRIDRKVYEATFRLCRVLLAVVPIFAGLVRTRRRVVVTATLVAVKKSRRPADACGRNGRARNASPPPFFPRRGRSHKARGMPCARPAVEHRF